MSSGAPATPKYRDDASRGRGRGTGRGNASGGRWGGDIKSGVCHLFVKTGKCRFGSECKYKHDSSPSSSSPVGVQSGTQGQGARKPRSTEERSFFNWKVSLNRRNAADPTNLEQLLETAIEFVQSKEYDVRQLTIKYLGESDEGLQWIKNIVESKFEVGYTVIGYSFYDHCAKFLKLVTLEEVTSSLILEKAVGTIYNVIYGGGQRGIRFFENVSDSLVSISSSNTVDSRFDEAISFATAGLYYTICLNQNAFIEEKFKQIAMRFENCVREHENTNNYHIRLSDKYIQKIRESLHMSVSIPNYIQPKEIPAVSVVGPASSYELHIDLPGELSTHGVRHDNDHQSIEKILILPTTGEIRSERSEFLPLKSKTAKHHEEGIYRLLDFQFRLLREDTAGQLRNAVCGLVKKWEVIVQWNNPAERNRALRSFDAKMSIFQNIKIERIRFERRGGMTIDISFNQPDRCARMSPRQRSEYWNDSRDLGFGSLVALVDVTQETSFLLVTDRIVSQNRRADPDNSGARKGIVDLASHPERAMISLQLVNQTSGEDQARMRALAKQTGPGNAVLVEFPGLLFPSFEPILKCLQNLHKNPNLPFIRWIAPPANTKFEASDGLVHIQPPLYLLKGGLAGVSLDLTCISNGNNPLRHSTNAPATVRELESNTTLDRGQCESLLLGLQKEIALIQGPPGTGKSYVGIQLTKVLLANWDRIKVGPIICVCYTNHALDQFLEHILDSGEKMVVRLGSRSKSEKVQKYTISEIRKGAEKSRTEKGNIWNCNRKLDDLKDDMEIIFKKISQPRNGASVVNYLRHNMQETFNSIFGDGRPDSEGFQTAKKYRNESQYFRKWLSGTPPPGAEVAPQHITRNRPLEALIREKNPWTLSKQERVNLMVYWESLMDETEQKSLSALVGDFEKAEHTLRKQYQESDKRCLEEARVIGVTTTGLASNSDLLRSLKSKVLIIEEAAEVLEAHTIAALLPSVEHAILIGDHLQLRAQISQYELSMESEQGKKYGLDQSLFERLANETFDGAKMPIATMDVQRRMHPSISELIRKTLYPVLIDHPSTLNHPEVLGMRRRLFWIDHRNREDSSKNDPKQTSKSNQWEANFVVSLVRHLKRQGVYGKDDIAVLTPYLGQLRMLRKKFMNSFELIIGDKDLEQVADSDNEDENPQVKPSQQNVYRGKLSDGLRIATVDNFQGEEAKVIVLSLVRSNEEKRCGFLKTFNRINVALSRARDGMYIIGDAETSCARVKMWSDVVDILQKDGNIGRKLELQCPRHLNDQIFVSEPEDFIRLSPEGGCSEQCGKRLDCGHTCILKCHSDPLHKAAKCKEDCTRQFKNCQHTCPKRCWEDCGRCVVKITSNITLPCGHSPSSLECYETVDLSKIKCQVAVIRTVPGCEHEVKVKCHVKMENYKCTHPCKTPLGCGHECTRECRQCRTVTDLVGNTPTYDHGICKKSCGRSYTTCNHACKKPCHEGKPCKPCDLPCEIFCSHSRCSKMCSEPCTPCAEKCTWSCTHRGSCNMPCAVPCDMLPCNERCSKDLECGHRCPSICGEDCPSKEFCQKCAVPEILTRVTDMLEFSTFGEANIDNDPIIFLRCGHFFGVNTLDGLMDLKETYILDEDDKILEPKQFVSPKLNIKNCPECRAPLRNIHRYNRVVKVALLNETTRRFVAYTATRFTKLLNAISDNELNLEKMASEFITKKAAALASTQSEFNKYKDTAKRFVGVVDKFLELAKKEEQPYGRVYSLVINERKRRGAVSKFELDNSLIQHGFSIRGTSLKLRLIWTVLWNFKKMVSQLTPAEIKVECNRWFLPQIKNGMDLCIALAKEAQGARMMKEGIEARISVAQFLSLEMLFREHDPIPRQNHEELLASVRQSLKDCLKQLQASTEHLRKEIENALGMLRGGTFHSFVSDEERKSVYAAMAQEFSGTGHWYYCENNHPFTIGNCGMARQEARCPECQAPVGGRNYQLAAGNRRAVDIEQQFREMGLN